VLRIGQSIFWFQQKRKVYYPAEPLLTSQDEVFHATGYVFKFNFLFIQAFSLKIFSRLEEKTNTHNQEFSLTSVNYTQSVREDVRFEVTHLHSIVSNVWILQIDRYSMYGYIHVPDVDEPGFCPLQIISNTMVSTCMHVMLVVMFFIT